MAMKPHDDPVIDAWANWWDADFFAAEPRLDALYRRLALEARMHLGMPELVAEAAAGGVAASFSPALRSLVAQRPMTASQTSSRGTLIFSLVVPQPTPPLASPRCGS